MTMATLTLMEGIARLKEVLKSLKGVVLLEPESELCIRIEVKLRLVRMELKIEEKSRGTNAEACLMFYVGCGHAL